MKRKKILKAVETLLQCIDDMRDYADKDDTESVDGILFGDVLNDAIDDVANALEN